MSRSAAGSHGVNLMPLLDVLLCTMGTLIVILGVLNREARFHPAKRSPEKAAAAAKLDELKNDREDLELRVQQLATAREKTLTDLDESRKRLSGIEDSSRQLENQLLALQSAAKNMQASDADTAAKRDLLRGQLRQLNAKRVQLDSELSKARNNTANRQPVYAVVPFEGMYKTSRRPIYIECRDDSVILQPEGIAFTAADFLGPGGPGNPLASALRAAQEYWRAAPRNDPNMPNEPYPLLLVRPDGIIAYYLVRDAMTSWDAEFGYEMIGADWKLDFPMQPEAQLKEMETHAVADARERLQWLAQSSPELFQRKPSKVQYHVSPFRGGAVRDGGPSLGTDPFADDPLGGFGRPSGKPNGSAFGANGNSGTGGGDQNLGAGVINGSKNGIGLARGNGMDAAGNGGFQKGTGAFGTSSNSQTNGNVAFGQNGGGPEIASVGPRYSGLGGGPQLNGASGMATGNGIGALDKSGNFQGSGLSNGSGTGSGDGTGSSASPNTKFGNAQGGAVANGSPSGGSSKGLSASEYGGVMLPDSAGGDLNSNGGTAGSSGGSESSGMMGSQAIQGGPSSTGTSSSAASSGRGNSASGGSSSGNSMDQMQAGGDSSSASGGSPSFSLDMSPQQMQQMEQTRQSQNNSQRSRNMNRQRNWALPNNSTASVPIQRPIRVECWNDRLVLLPDSRDVQAEVIPLPERTSDAIDPLVSAVRTYTKTWGIAGRGMYWKPQLMLDVTPGGESRAADLKELLSDSGWDVKRK